MYMSVVVCVCCVCMQAPSHTLITHRHMHTYLVEPTDMIDINQLDPQKWQVCAVLLFVWFWVTPSGA